jgi:hypothetical protein
VQGLHEDDGGLGEKLSLVSVSDLEIRFAHNEALLSNYVFIAVVWQIYSTVIFTMSLYGPGSMPCAIGVEAPMACPKGYHARTHCKYAFAA